MYESCGCVSVHSEYFQRMTALKYKKDIKQISMCQPSDPCSKGVSKEIVTTNIQKICPQCNFLVWKLNSIIKWPVLNYIQISLHEWISQTKTSQFLKITHWFNFRSKASAPFLSKKPSRLPYPIWSCILGRYSWFVFGHVVCQRFRNISFHLHKFVTNDFQKHQEGA